MRYRNEFLRITPQANAEINAYSDCCGRAFQLQMPNLDPQPRADTRARFLNATPFIIRRQRHRDSVLQISSQRMLRPPNAEDRVVARQADFDQHVAAGHLAH